MTTERECPYCGAILLKTINIAGNNSPKPGDVGACIECAGLIIITDDIRMAPLSNEALTLLMARDPDAFHTLQRVKKAIEEARRV